MIFYSKHMVSHSKHEGSLTPSICLKFQAMRNAILLFENSPKIFAQVCIYLAIDYKKPQN